jgi:hypothetical protein
VDGALAAVSGLGEATSLTDVLDALAVR